MLSRKDARSARGDEHEQWTGARDMALQGFYWLERGVLAGCARPGGRGGEAVAADLAELRERGIGAVLSLTESPLDEVAVEGAGMAYLHVPVDDLQPPEPEQLEQALAFIDGQRARGRAVAAHCLMGQGRTGTVLAAYLIRAGRTPEEALRELRAVCPGAVSAPVQQRALEAFARRRDWIV
jgi:atypical dual specificity phosphatase